MIEIELTRREAIRELKEMKKMPWNDSRQDMALDMAISALETDEKALRIFENRKAREKFNDDLGDYPGVMSDQFDNMTGSMNL